MQTQLLQSSSTGIAHYGFANCKLPNTFLSTNRPAIGRKRGFAAVYVRDNRRGQQTMMRVALESGKEKLQKSMTESSGSELNAKDLETRDESLLQQQQQQQQQQHLSSTGTALFPPGSSLRELSFTEHHLLLLGFVACVTTGALSCVLLAAIPTMIAMKRAAESLGKLADTARDELPGTMAAVRLSGMEISDLTMELSDLGQEISAGVRNSSRAVRAAEDGLRRIGNLASVAVLQERVSGQVEVAKPAVAHVARSTREALVRARSLVNSLITLARLSSWLRQFWKFIRPWQRKAITAQSR